MIEVPGGLLDLLFLALIAAAHLRQMRAAPALPGPVFLGAASDGATSRHSGARKQDAASGV